MATTENVRELLRQYDLGKALIIDDAFDVEPQYETLHVEDPDGEVADALDALQEGPKERLAEILRSEELAEDDWETGLRLPKFLAELWELKLKGILPEKICEIVFEVHSSEKEQKLQQLAPLQQLLKNDLHLHVDEIGRDGTSLPHNTKIVFLDLFMGVTRQDRAREEAADKIKLLLKDLKDRDRPVVVLMSTETGEELESWAAELRSSAALLGAKFRVISKTEFNHQEPLLNLLEELLTPLDKAQTIAGLLDEWDAALQRLRADVMRDLRNFDLSDCAYLKHFRLDAEGMPLGMYLVEAYSDVLKYRLEGCLPLLKAATDVDMLNFEELPPAHFLPNQGVNWLTHAMSFINEEAIKARGYQFAGASGKVELGDIIIAKPRDWVEEGSLVLSKDMPVYAVISQACDLQQNKSDAILLLLGTLRPRTWDDPIRPQDTRLDCFRFRGREYVIEWEKAKLDAWPKRLADRRLKPGGTHLRIAKLRALPALKAQQIFASNLTRIGTLANPHVVVPVGLKVIAKDEAGRPHTIYEASVKEQTACILKGMILDGKRTSENEYLVFKSTFGAKLGTKLQESLEVFHPSVRTSVAEFAASHVHLAQLRLPCRIGQRIEHGQLKIDVRRGEQERYTQNLTIIAVIEEVTA